ncbi:MAG: hypothetical protein JXB30_12935 [Anaerolineae bacterium]|nr:hypothetical protein [Anaerolineae bacterium]
MLYVLCSSSRVVTLQELATFILEGVYFDQDPYLDPSWEEMGDYDEDWSYLSVIYDPGKEPIVFRRYLEYEYRFQEVVGGLFVGVAQSNRRITSRQSVLSHLEETVQLIDIESSRDELDENCWAMLDTVETFLARECNGLVFASGDGFYDENLVPIFRV